MQSGYDSNNQDCKDLWGLEKLLITYYMLGLSDLRVGQSVVLEPLNAKDPPKLSAGVNPRELRGATLAPEETNLENE